MPRSKQYLREEVLDKAMTVFWTRGFGDTSMRDLTEATGLNPGSLYEEFGDKHGLFLASVEHYRREVVHKRLAMMREPGLARDKLQAFFDNLVEFAVREGRLLGCLMTNSTIELAPHDNEVRELVTMNQYHIKSAFQDLIAQGIRDGEFAPNQSVEDLAEFLLCTVQGLRVLSKTGPEEAKMRAIIQVALSNVFHPTGAFAPDRDVRQ